ncbi:sodium:proton exchanger [Orenia metallireducens]|jgi:Kef-type K+ transport system membrane component KefB|uniref:Sodium:proton exchanger n=1 Tax=Orenia metallireducens TaxID=1413210 RepID=A0A1C0AA82_9FIRM|nr:cation:proton antiporter [Orenia metallireducens]OCL27195.1 sodium:proton exchanger [Orenia metallireducens]
MHLDIELVHKLQIMREWFLVHQASDKVIYIIGFLIFMSLLVVLLAKRFHVPIVVGYVFLGIALSVNIIEWLPFLSEEAKEWYAFTTESFDYIATFALAFIAFTIGSELSVKILKSLGKKIIYIAILEATGAFIIVALATFAITKTLYLSLVLGAIASATAPAATVMVLKEYNAEGLLTSMILAIVGIDDAIALIIFSLVEPLALGLYLGQGDISIFHALFAPAIEIGGSILAGLLIGYLSQKFISNIDDKTKKILTLVSTIIGGSAISIFLHLSPLITNMFIGFAYRNFARKNLGIAEYMETLTVPLYALFFILAGTEIRLDSIASAGFLILAFVYTIARVIGKIGGASLGAHLSDAPEKIKKYVGLGLLPQSGVAIALAYTVQKHFIGGESNLSVFNNIPLTDNVGLLVFNTLLFTAALTEVFGPLATKYAITKAGEIGEH